MEDVTVSIDSLLDPYKEVEFDFPGYEGFKVRICHVARSELLKLTKQSTVTKWDKNSHQPRQEMDEEKFGVNYTKAVVKGWSGLKYRYLEELLPVNISNKDPDDVVPYSPENAVVIMKNSQAFEGWVTEIAGNLANFTTAK